MPLIYLDHHATTPIDPRVIEAMMPYWSMPLGNPSNPHHVAGKRAAEAIAAARAQVAGLVQVDPREIIFTSGATEANNLAILGVMRAAPGGSHLIVSAIEHASVMEPAAQLQREGHEVTFVPVDRLGRVSPDDVARALTNRTVLVSIMAANNEIGTLQPIVEIGRLCRERGVLFHTDVVQAAATMPLTFDDWSVDLASLSAHKMYGPMGVGALVIRRRTPRVAMQPLVFGGGQEQRRRAGTLPTPLIVGFGATCELARTTLDVEPERIAALRDQLWSRLKSRVDGLTLNGDPVHRLPGNLHFSVAGVDGDALLAALGEVCVSSGAACSASDHKLSHVLQAIGVEERAIRSSLRVGVGRFNTVEEIDTAADVIASSIERLRGIQCRTTGDTAGIRR